jgi:MFS family permease
MPRLSPIAAAVAVTVLGVLPAYLTGALAVQMGAELGFGAAVLGAVIAGAFLASAAGAFAGGHLADRLGAVRVMRTACMLATASAAAVAALVHDVPGLALALVVGGLSNGIGQPASNALLAAVVPRGRQGTAFGAKQAAIPAAVLLGGMSVPGIALTVGWRWTFMIAAAFALVVSALLPAERQPPAAPAVSVPAAQVRFGPLLMLGLGGLFGAAAANALAAFVVVAAVAADMGPAAAGLLASLGSGACVLSRLAIGVVADRRPRYHLVAVALMLAIGSGGFALLATGSLAALVPGVLLAYVFGWSWPGLYHYAAARLHPGAAGRATGLTTTGVAVGAALGPLAFGAVAEHASFGTAWLVAGTWGLAASLAVIVGRRTLLRAVPPDVLAAARARPKIGTAEAEE